MDSPMGRLLAELGHAFAEAVPDRHALLRWVARRVAEVGSSDVIDEQQIAGEDRRGPAAFAHEKAEAVR